jgi:tetratricopeptide (TPR) repeat protein
MNMARTSPNGSEHATIAAKNTFIKSKCNRNFHTVKPLRNPNPMKPRFLILVFLLITHTLCAQTVPKWVIKGLDDGDNKHYEAAIADYTRAIAIDPGYSDAWYYRGQVKSVLGRYNGAIADFSRVIALEPKSPFAYYSRGMAKLKLKRYTSAIPDFDRSIAIDSAYVSVAAFYNRGIAKNFLGRFAEAVADYDRVIKLLPRDTLAYCKRAEAKNNLGLYTEAIADCSHAITLDPKSYLAYAYRGYAHYKLGKTKENYRKAIADYDMAIQLGGSNYKPDVKYRDEAVAALALSEGP